MTKELVLNVESYDIEPSKAEQIEKTFIPMIAMLKNFESAYDLIITEAEQGITREVTQKAKRVRIDIAKVRIETDKIRTREKAEYLRAGKAIDGVANILKFAVIEKEEKLKEIETHYERIEQERLEDIQKERWSELNQYDADIVGIDLSTMPDDVYEKFKDGYRLAYENKKEAEKKAEEERLIREEAEKKRQIEIEAENKRLKAEVEEREKKAKIEADERAKAEKKEADKREKERIKQEAILHAEKKEREKVENELAEKKAEEERLADEKTEKEKAARLAPDKEKLLLFAGIIQDIVFPMSTNPEVQKILAQARERLEKTYTDVIEQAKKL